MADTGPIRVGVVGGGFVAQVVHLPRLAELPSRFTLTALAEPDAARRRRLARRHAIPHACATHDELLERGVVDALVVCAPNAAHAGIVLAALAAGVHVLVEKPLCLTVGDAEAIVAARDRAGRVVQVGYMKRFDPAFEALVAGLRRDRPQLLHVATLTYDPGLPGAFALPDEPPAAPPAVDVRSDVVLGALVHDVNLVHGVLEALGEPYPGRVAEAFARADGRAAGGTIALGDTLRWTLAWLRVDGLGEFAERITLIGESDIRELEFPAPYLHRAPTRYSHSAGGGAGNVTMTARSWEEAYVRQLVHFHACVTRGETCRTPPEQALADVACLEALHQAAA